jgi:GNAT superfamily N-acetyltransferase
MDQQITPIRAIYKYFNPVATEIVFAIESVASAEGALRELVPAHHQEVNEFGECALDINWPAYRRADQQGRYVLITARSGGDLIGWVGYFVYEHLRHRGSCMAREDWYYVRPEQRGQGIGRRLFELAEQTLQKRGVKRIIMSCKVRHDHTDLIESLGYQPLEKTFTRLLETADER